jgi:hypothetical protein
MTTSEVKTQPTLTHAVGMESVDSEQGIHRRVEILKFKEGSFGITLVTKKEGEENLITRIHLKPTFFNLLVEALAYAQHNIEDHPASWDQGQEGEKDE